MHDPSTQGIGRVEHRCLLLRHDKESAELGKVCPGVGEQSWPKATAATQRNRSNHWHLSNSQSQTSSSVTTWGMGRFTSLAPFTRGRAARAQRSRRS